MSETKLIFHNGLQKIGGTIVEIRTETSRVIFDFSTEMGSDLERKENSLAQRIKDGEFPFLEGWLSPELEAEVEVALGRQVNQDLRAKYAGRQAIFLSHLHLDHCEYINFSDPDIPVYASPGTRQMIQLLNEEGEFLAKGKCREANLGNCVDYTRPIQSLPAGEFAQVGDIKVELIPVDHDCLGASAIRVETENGVIVYTGDIRLHGFFPERTEAFMRRVKNCDVLISEGVSISFHDPDEDSSYEVTTEPLLLDKVEEVLRAAAERPLLFNYYPGNLDRIEAWIKRLSPIRQVVLEAKNAKILKECRGIEVPYYIEKSPVAGLDPALKLDIGTLIADAKRFFWQLDWLALKKIERKLAGGSYILSDAMPFGEWCDAWEDFLELLAQAELELLVMPSSGHATTSDLKRIVAEIAPKILVPVHSLHPERLENPSGERLLPEKQQEFVLN